MKDKNNARGQFNFLLQIKINLLLVKPGGQTNTNNIMMYAV